MSLGEVIAAYRKKHGLSMEKFSELSGISKGTELAAGASKTVTVTFAYGNGVSTNKTLNSLVDISFVLVG